MTMQNSYANHWQVEMVPNLYIMLTVHAIGYCYKHMQCKLAFTDLFVLKQNLQCELMEVSKLLQYLMLKRVLHLP